MSTPDRKQSLPRPDESRDDDDEIVIEVLEHPTRDDWHEQRERRQTCEGVVHVHVVRIARDRWIL